MKESDDVKFEDKYKALEYISKLPEEGGRIEIKIVTKAQIEREKRMRERTRAWLKAFPCSGVSGK